MAQNSAFIDTSAFLAVLDRDDRHHAEARQVWEQLIRSGASLLCTNYVLVETLALVQSRLGLAVLRAFAEQVVPILQVEWVDEVLHQAGLAALLTANRRQLSLVDCVSFAAARQLGVRTAFAFDRQFEEQGFARANPSG